MDTGNVLLFEVNAEAIVGFGPGLKQVVKFVQDEWGDGVNFGFDETSVNVFAFEGATAESVDQQPLARFGVNGVQYNVDVVFLAVFLPQGDEEFYDRVHIIVVMAWPNDLEALFPDGNAMKGGDVTGVDDDIVDLSDVGTVQLLGLFHGIRRKWHVNALLVMCSICER